MSKMKSAGLGLVLGMLAFVVTDHAPARAQDTAVVRALPEGSQQQVFMLLAKVADLREENEQLLVRVDALEKRVGALEVVKAPEGGVVKLGEERGVERSMERSRGALNPASKASK